MGRKNIVCERIKYSDRDCILLKHTDNFDAHEVVTYP